jgi:hypothetical protein
MANFKADMMLNNGTKDVHAVADASTNAIATITYTHHEIHGGSAYYVLYSALANTAGTISIRIGTPNTTKWAHMVFDIEASLAATAQMWFPTTKTHEAGNAIVPMNRNHNSTNTSGLTVCHTPGGAQAGTAQLTKYFGATATGGRVAGGGGASNRHEFILKQNSSYYILLTSRADGNAMSITLDWYEHTAKG